MKYDIDNYFRLGYRLTPKAREFIFNPKNDKYYEHFIRFCSDDAIECIEQADKLHRTRGRISVDSLKMSYILFENYNELFLPIYYRSYYGPYYDKWYKSAGSCYGTVYKYCKNKSDKVDAYLCFERLNDLVKKGTTIKKFIPDRYNVSSDSYIYSEDIN